MTRRIFAHAFIAFSLVGTALSYACRSLSGDSASKALKEGAEARPSKTLGLNDVSIFIPIQNESDFAAFPRLDGAGDRGSYLEADIAKKISELGFGPLEAGIKPNRANSVDRKIYIPVAFRFDPCFPAMNADDKKCQRQIRVIWEVDNIGLRSTAGDNAIHTLYNLSSDEFRDAVKTLAQLKKDSGLSYTEDALGPHPVIKKETVNGPYAQGIFSLLKKYCGRSNLFQVAFVFVTAQDEEWVFGLLDTAEGKALVQKIPTLGSERQVLEFQFQGGTFIQSEPKFSAKDSLNDYIASPNASKKAINTMARIENPHMNNVATTDCASCHLAAGARLDMQEKLGGTAAIPDEFKAPGWNLSSPHILPLERLSVHNFSYIGAEPSINSRTVYESSQVAAWINQNIF